MPTISEILTTLSFSPYDYYESLCISNESYFQIQLKRQPNECFMNHYFTKAC